MSPPTGRASCRIPTGPTATSAISSYAIGSAYGAQYLLEMQKDLDVEAAVRSGKLTAINRWLEEKIWKYGCMKDPVALFESGVCGPFRPEEYVAYLEKKFTEIYEL